MIIQDVNLDIATKHFDDIDKINYECHGFHAEMDRLKMFVQLSETSPDLRLIGLKNDDAFVGLCCAVISRGFIDARDSCSIMHFGVKKEFRGHGCAKIMLDEVESWAKKSGCHHVSMHIKRTRPFLGYELDTHLFKKEI